MLVKTNIFNYKIITNYIKNLNNNNNTVLTHEKAVITEKLHYCQHHKKIIGMLHRATASLYLRMCVCVCMPVSIQDQCIVIFIYSNFWQQTSVT